MDFSPNGTKYFTLTALSIIRPFVINESLLNLKYNLWEKGIEFEYFHAAEDTYTTRKEVFEIVSRSSSKMVIDSIIVEKCKIHPFLHDNAKFYKKIFEILLNYILARYRGQFSQVVIVTDQIPIKKKRKDIEKAIKLYINRWSLETKIPYKIFHYASKSDINLQLVDYFNWAIYRKWNKGDIQNYDIIEEMVASEFEVFKSGITKYY